MHVSVEFYTNSLDNLDTELVSALNQHSFSVEIPGAGEPLNDGSYKNLNALSGSERELVYEQIRQQINFPELESRFDQSSKLILQKDLQAIKIALNLDMV
jgi:hypothetical protein